MDDSLLCALMSLLLHALVGVHLFSCCSQSSSFLPSLLPVGKDV